MGGRSKTSAVNKSSVINNVKTDNRILGAGSISAEGGSEVSVTQTDFGAVQAGLQLGEKSLENSLASLNSAFDFAGENVDDAFNFASTSQALVAEGAGTMFEAAQENVAAANSNSAATISKVLKFADDQRETEATGMANNILLYGGLAAVAVVGLFFFSGKRGMR